MIHGPYNVKQTWVSAPLMISDGKCRCLHEAFLGGPDTH